jgi:hypothetical protein
MIQKTVIKRKPIRERVPFRGVAGTANEPRVQQVECSNSISEQPQQTEAPQQKE